MGRNERSVEVTLGQHVLVECYGCNRTILGDSEKVEEVLITAAKDSGATVIGHQFHRFSPQGVSGFVVIAESHFSIHTWPEHDYAAVDIFTCGETIDFELAIQSIQEGFQCSFPSISARFGRGYPLICERVLHGEEGKGSEEGMKLHPKDYSLSFDSYYQGMNAWGVSISLDLYSVNAFSLEEEDMRGFFSELLRLQGNVGQVEEQVTGTKVSEDGGDLLLKMSGSLREPRLILQEPYRSMINFCLILKPGQNVHMDFLFEGFIEPRNVAEFICHYTSAEKYRMNVSIRV